MKHVKSEVWLSLDSFHAINLRKKKWDKKFFQKEKYLISKWHTAYSEIKHYMVVCYLLDTRFVLNFEANKIIKMLKLDRLDWSAS